MSDRIQVPSNYYSNSFLNPTHRWLLELLRVDIKFVKGEGAHLFDEHGKEYIDFLAQYGALPFGHNNSELWEALWLSYTNREPSMAQPLIAFRAEELAAKLADLAPGELTYSILTNSGAETVEAAIKLARSKTGRQMILSATNGFHGQTLGALSATRRSFYHRGFGVPLPGFEEVLFGDLNALEETLAKKSSNIAAFIVEPIQGEGGIIIPPDGYLAAAQALCRRHGVAFIVDEIQTGLGRTGSLFAIEREGIVPDMLLLSKALSGGIIPIGACIVKPEFWDHNFGYKHTSTFANNNVAASVALKVLELLVRDDRAIVREVSTKGIYLYQQLAQLMEDYPGVIREVRARGLMVGLEFSTFSGDESYIMSYFAKNQVMIPCLSGHLLNIHRLITAPAFTDSLVLRLEPPLIITESEIDYAINALRSTVDAMARLDTYSLVRFLIGDHRHPDEHGKKYATQAKTPMVARKYDAEKVETFAFLMHPIYPEDFIAGDPSFEQFTDDELNRWTQWATDIGPGTVYHLPEVCSTTGKIAQGWLIVLPMLPHQMIRYGRSNLFAFLNEAINLAKDQGAQIMGLGGFTSVVSKGGEMITGRGLPLTTGNTTTAVLGLKGIKQAAALKSLELSKARVAIVGATGAVGRLLAMLLAPYVGQIMLLGNPQSADSPLRCQAIAREILNHVLSVRNDSSFDGLLMHELRAGHATPEQFIRFGALTNNGSIDVMEHGQEALSRADIIVLATSATTTILTPEMPMQNAIVCDIALPSNVSPRMTAERPDVYVFRGGFAQLPDRISFGRELEHFQNGISVGCLAETMLLALEGAYHDFSIGPRLSVQDAQKMDDLLFKHGFVLPPLPGEPV